MATGKEPDPEKDIRFFYGEVIERGLSGFPRVSKNDFFQ